jgi:acyl-CoA synthetase (AMP-forming)/AMP-acid ligase II
MIPCQGFDAVVFWDLLERGGDTRFCWYYASPTMHQAILAERARRGPNIDTRQIRFVANAAGGLLPALAAQLQVVFPQATILTSYGMSECMPISSPPMEYKLDPVGTSGKAIGPQLCISNEAFTNKVAIGVVGQIMVSE